MISAHGSCSTGLNRARPPSLPELAERIRVTDEPAQRMMCAMPLKMLALLGAMATAVCAHASVHSLQDCREGADFISNAARARDNGMAREAFISRLEDDFMTIRAFPPALRWFVNDEDDERFLRDAVHRLHDHPLDPAMHGRQFLAACLDRIASSAAKAG